MPQRPSAELAARRIAGTEPEYGDPLLALHAPDSELSFARSVRRSWAGSRGRVSVHPDIVDRAHRESLGWGSLGSESLGWGVTVGTEAGSASAPPNAGPERDPAPVPPPPADDVPTGGDVAGLSERDLAVLAMARRSWHTAGAKERAIREQLDMSPTRYYQVLNTLLERPEALAHDPVTVNRLRRMRDARRSRR